MNKFIFEASVLQPDYSVETKRLTLADITRTTPVYKRGVSIVTFRVMDVDSGEYFKDVNNDTDVFHMLAAPNGTAEVMYSRAVNVFKSLLAAEFNPLPAFVHIDRIKDSCLVDDIHIFGVSVVKAVQTELFEVFGSQIIVRTSNLEFAYTENGTETNVTLPVSFKNRLDAIDKINWNLSNRVR